MNSDLLPSALGPMPDMIDSDSNTDSNSSNNSSSNSNKKNNFNKKISNNVDNILEVLSEENNKPESIKNSTIVEAPNNNAEPKNNTPKLQNQKLNVANNVSSLKNLENSVKHIENKMDIENEKYNKNIILRINLDYETVNRDKLIDITRRTLDYLPVNYVTKNNIITEQKSGNNNNVSSLDILKLVDIYKIRPMITLRKDKLKTNILIKNLSQRDYDRLVMYQERVEEYILNKYLDMIENIKTEEENIVSYEDVKYYKEDEDNGKLNFYNKDGIKINIIKVQSRIVNINRISQETRILYANLLTKLPKKLIQSDKSHANLYNSNTSESEEEKKPLQNTIRNTATNTINKIKNSFKRLIPRSEKEHADELSNNDENESDVLENIMVDNNEIKNVKPVIKRRKRTLKNNYSFHKIPEKKGLKNSTIKPKKSAKKIIKKKTKSPKKKKLPKIKKLKVQKRAKKLKKILLNHSNFHKIRVR